MRTGQGTLLISTVKSTATWGVARLRGLGAHIQVGSSVNQAISDADVMHTIGEMGLSS